MEVRGVVPRRYGSTTVRDADQKVGRGALALKAARGIHVVVEVPDVVGPNTRPWW